ncbi:hypothetical protein KP509_09G021700 [Ceratopteris richardii]|uniref:TPX2 central domain-containing protein n=1 Tax=Ceratopteris richardii TaxID=49495 RepID=A0A8T2U5J3_CERRI|nr:hypothetical protein KP509_09G021700 [Ceratopteris richardii]
MSTGTETRNLPVAEFRIDLKYEFSAPKYFDFCAGETEEEAAAAERWFAGAIGHPISPLVGKVKRVEELSKGCSLEEYIEVQKLVARVTPEISSEATKANMLSDIKEDSQIGHPHVTSLIIKEIGALSEAVNAASETGVEKCKEVSKEEPCTPKEQVPQRFAELQSVNGNKKSGLVVPSRWKHQGPYKHGTVNQLQASGASRSRAIKRSLNESKKDGPDCETRTIKKQKHEGHQTMNAKTPCCTIPLSMSRQYHLNTEKQPSKRQKLEGGQFGQVMHSKIPQTTLSLTVPQEFHFHTDKRAYGHSHCIANSQGSSSSMPYIPVAEMVQRFQMNILADFKTQDKAGMPRKRNLKLTHPKEPMLGTSLRTRPLTVKSFIEQEEELLANLPKFKARPLNKRILLGPTLLPPPRSIPQLPEFQEFTFKTMERALMHQHDHSVTPMTVSIHQLSNKERSGFARREVNQERLRTVKELEQQLAAMPKLRARQPDTILSSRGETGVSTVPEYHITVPKKLNENQMFQENVIPFQSQMQQMSRESMIGQVHSERVRKPLGEIQQQKIFGNATQLAKHNYTSLLSHSKVGFHSEEFPVHTRSMKELRQHLTPARVTDAQTPMTTFPVYFMR